MSFNLLINTDTNETDIKAFQQHLSSILRELSSDLVLDDCVTSLLFESENKNLHVELSNIFKKIENDRTLGINYQNAFISAPLAIENNAYFSKLRVMQARLWSAAYTLIQLTGYQDTIHRAFDEFRLLASNSNSELLTLLPEFNLPDETLIDELINVKKKVSRSKANKVQKYIKLLKNYVIRAPENKPRNPPNNLINAKSGANKVLISTNLAVEATEPTIQRFIGVESACDESDENVIDKSVTAQFISVKTPTKSEAAYSMNIKIQQAKSAANAIQKRDRKLITEVGSLTDFEIKKLILNTEHYAKNHSSTYGLLLLSLFSGRHIEKIISYFKQKKLTYDDFQYTLSETIKLPEHKFEDIEVHGKLYKKEQLEQLLTRSDKNIKLSYPSLTPAMAIKKSWEELEAQLKKLLKKINKKWHTNITLPKIQNHFAYYLQNHAVDTAEQTLLLGNDVHQSSANYYYQLPNNRLTIIHEHYKKSLLEQSLLKPLKLVYTDEKIGSQLQLKQEKLGLLLNNVAERLGKTSKSNPSVIESFHNLYTCYTMLVLNLATGYRPVRDPFDDIKHFDLINKTVLINDKNVRGRLSVRVCKLPCLAIKQLQEYLIHVERLSSSLMPINNKLGSYFKDILFGEKPLFSFIKDNELTRAIPKNIEVEFQSILPIPDTWHRHFLRTFLRENSVPPEIVDAFMGHSHTGDISFEKFSGLSLTQLSQVAEVIQTKLFEASNIDVVKGWRSTS